MSNDKEQEILSKDDEFLTWIKELEKENVKFMIKYHGKRKKKKKEVKFLKS